MGVNCCDICKVFDICMSPEYLESNEAFFRVVKPEQCACMPQSKEFQDHCGKEYANKLMGKN